MTLIEQSEEGALRRSLAAACAMTKVAASSPGALLSVCVGLKMYVYVCVTELECRPPCEAGPGPVGQVQRAGH